MAKILEFMEHRDQWIQERYELIRERMDELVKEDMSGLSAEAYLKDMAQFLFDTLRVYDLKEAQVLDTLPVEQQQGIHDQMYQAAIWQRYDTLSDACWDAGEEWGPLLWAVAQEWKLAARYACEGQRFLLTIAVELFLQVYQIYEMERAGELQPAEMLESVRQAVYSHFSDYCDVVAALAYHEQFYPGEFHQQLVSAGMEELGGLYRLGGRVDAMAQARSEKLMSMDASDMVWRKDRVEHIVAALVDARQQEIVAHGAAGEAKNRIALYVPVGFEPMAQMLYDHLTEAGFQVVCLRRHETLTARIAELYEPQQIPELPLFWDRGLKDRRLTEEKNALDAYKELCQQRLTVLCLEDEEEWKEAFAQASLEESQPEELEDAMDVASLSISQKQEHLYTEFVQELRQLRTSVWTED